MKKETKKTKSTFSGTEVDVIIEEMRSQFRAFGEKLKAIDDKIDSTMGMVAKNTEDITWLKLSIDNTKSEIIKVNGKLAQIDSRLAKVEDKLTLHMETSHT